MTFNLCFYDLKEEIQQEIYNKAKQEVINEFGEDMIKEKAQNLSISYDILLRCKADEQIIKFNFKFTI